MKSCERWGISSKGAGAAYIVPARELLPLVGPEANSLKNIPPARAPCAFQLIAAADAVHSRQVLLACLPLRFADESVAHY